MEETTRLCSVDGCGRPAQAAGMCGMHYQRVWRSGSTDLPQKDPVQCSIEGCTKTAKARGWCAAHHQRWFRHGDPLYTNDRKQDLGKRFWAKVEKSNTCWTWTGAKTFGYGKFYVDGERLSAHRVSWELNHGAIPPGMLVDHICHNPACVRPDHLRLATKRQNVEYRKGAQSNSSTGVRGVYKKRGKFSVVVQSRGKPHYFGCYPTLEEAQQVAIRARSDLFDFPEFGI